MRSLTRTIFALGCAAALAAGCGGGNDGGGSSPGSGGSGGSGSGGGGTVTPTSGPFQPLVVNASWTYHVNDKGVEYDKPALFEAVEDMGGPKAGTMGYRMRETLPTQAQLTWYTQVGQVVAREHEQAFDTTGRMTSEDWYDPYRLRVDETPDHLTSGANWNWSYMDMHTSLSKPASNTSSNETWTVAGVDVSVTVPAGTFAALKLVHADAADGSTKTYWFTRGVGKVREETSAGHVEELTAYTIPTQ
jgi:hypothetical protein